MLELKTESERERVLMECNKRWKNEGETSSREMRRLLRRKMTRLSLGYLTQVHTEWWARLYGSCALVF